MLECGPSLTQRVVIIVAFLFCESSVGLLQTAYYELAVSVRAVGSLPLTISLRNSSHICFFGCNACIPLAIGVHAEGWAKYGKFSRYIS